LILPGGESTVIGTLIGIQAGILQSVRRRISQGMPVLGTCAGMILLAKRAYDRVLGDTKQHLLSNLDIVVERNAFGRQSDSFEADLRIPTLGKNNRTFKGVFIRAPVVAELGVGIDIFAEFNKRIVGVKQGNIIGTSFHPELSDDDRIHRHFVRTVLEWKKRERVEKKSETNL
jgi:5'-phosphate synthase pdxT subunit